MSLADCTVMVVEDHEFQRHTMLQILANLGTAGLFEAADGESALALLAGDRRIDVVVCDLDMPEMDGVEFLRNLSARSIDTAVVIASGLDDAVVRSAAATARAYGVDVLGVIRKPLTARRLLEVVGLHRPAFEDLHQPNGRHEALWRRALGDGQASVRLIEYVDLMTGTTAGVRAAATRGAGTEAADDLGAHVSSDVLAAITDLVFDVACRTLLHRSGLDATLVLPSAAFDDLTLADRLAGRAHDRGVRPARLCVALPRRPELSPRRLDVLTRLRLHGFGLGLEKFTTGEAGVGTTAGLPLTEVALARGIATEALAADGRVLEAAIASLHARGVRVVATGCRDAEELALLAQAGCDRAERPGGR